MADLKITELPEIILPSYGDIIPIVHNPLTAPVNNYTNLTNLFGGIKLASSYGVKADGVTDDTVALQAAVSSQGHIILPPGTILVSDFIDYYGNTWIEGAGRGSTIIKVKDGTTLSGGQGILRTITASDITQTVKNVLIEHLSINGNKDNVTGTYEGIVMMLVSHGVINDVEAYNCTETGINPDNRWFTDGTITPDYTNLMDVWVTNCYVHDNTNDGIQTAFANIINCYAYDNGTGIRVVTANDAAEVPFLHCKIIGCNAFNNNGIGFLFETQGSKYIDSVIMDGCISSRNTWGIVSYLFGLTVSNSVFSHNTTGGVGILGYDEKFIGNTIKNNVGWGIQLYGGPRRIQIIGNRIFDDQTVPTQTYGIGESTYDGNGNNILIANNDLIGNGTSPFDAAIPTHPEYTIINNTGYNPVGLSAITVGASPYTYTAGCSPETIYIYGGTVSNVSRASTQIASASPCQVHLEPHQALTVTYSVLPTMVKDIK